MLDMLEKSDFVEKMKLGAKICDELRIDFYELFCNGKIQEKSRAPDLSAGGKRAAEILYLTLCSSAQRETIEYMDGMLGMVKIK